MAPDPVHESLGSQPVLQNVALAKTIVDTLQRIFALMDLTHKSSENIDDALQHLPQLPELHPNSPGDDMKGLFNLAVVCEVLFARQGILPADASTGLTSRLFLSRTGYEEKDITEPLTLDVQGNDVSTVEVITASTNTEPNTLEVAIFNHLLKPPIKSFVVRRAPILAIRVHRHEGLPNTRVPFVYPKILYLDPFLWENRELVLEKVQEIEQVQDNTERISKV